MDSIEADRKQYPNTFKQIETHIDDISVKTLQNMAILLNKQAKYVQSI